MFIKSSALAALTLFAASAGAVAQISVGLGAQVADESAILDGGKYILQSQASGTPYIVDNGTYYFVPNAGNSPTTAAVYYFYKNDDGTWRIKNQYSGRYWGVPVYGEDLKPGIELEAGHWSLNFSAGIAYPTAPDAGGIERGLDRSSQHLWGYTTGTGITKRVKLFEVDAPLSVEALPEFERKVVEMESEPVADIAEGTWYVMFDRGLTDNRYAHGYLYEDAASHTLYNRAEVPSGTATRVAHYLVRLIDAGEGRYYVQNGYGNYFGAFTQGKVVPVVAEATEAIAIEKISGNDGHFSLQCMSTGIMLDANDLRDGPATVVGWGSTPPTNIGGNNDWAFYPVKLEEIGAEVALFEGDVQVKQGYQTTGRGNRDALLLSIFMTPSQPMQPATFTFTLNEAAQANVSALRLYVTKDAEFTANKPSASIGVTEDIAGQTSITVSELAAGSSYLWLCADVREDAALGAILDAALTSITYTTSAETRFELGAAGNPERQGLKVFERQNIVFAPTSNNCRFYRIPAMELDADGNIVVAVDKRYNSNSDLGNHKIDVVSMRSLDGGATWQDLAPVATGDGSTAAYFGYGDAALARTQTGEIVCMMAAGSKMWGSNATDGMKYAGFARSSDNGCTWKLTKNLFTSNIFTDENSADGKLSVANIFTSSGKGLTTSDGVIMFTTNCRLPGTSSPNLCYILYSTDDGATWRLSNALAYSGCDESKIVELNDGRLLLSVRQSGNRGWNTGSYTKNADGTVTFKWDEQYRTGDLWGNACNADLVYYSREKDGQPDILVHSYINTSGRESLQLAMSIDGGKTWKSVYNIQPNGACYSTMILLPDGTLALLYEDESYSAGNGYAINFVTITREQILEWFQQIGGKLPDGIESLTTNPSPTGEGNRTGEGSIYSVSGQRMSKPQRGISIVDGRKVVVK